MESGDENRDEQRRFGGRVLIRMPVSLHRELVEAAKAERVSLNQFVCALLASGMRWRQVEGDRGDAAPDPERGKDRLSDEEYDRIWREAFR
jgi:hypothetical protein